ncbi:hypothetical protein QEG60_004074 [Pluralibacter gergoviae]|uniref:hypothetical protein n=1 Tax=Pluralibacter gergoviae TaxID=61647 RepID=UPI000A3940E7|nr:hypothetical protein [Pluralibacter gergoviae]EKT9643070.1 hypothetical protein [Pluralibacter gergoviae]EKV3545326.1 hypothetical protein [Pluralibacter gergoviae]EKV9898252.1 hypothetical protein [Pluralibacter gergoviae]EKV9933092.1 hypothetical protein [Pluralibacter gergoviae]EMD1658814.1 hypothetical protein [Pluralibacter gergoviae]
MDQETIEEVIISAARLSGHELNGHERLIVRTRVSSALAAKERHRQRMAAAPYQWKKPAPRR